MQNLLSLSATEWDAEILPGEEEVFNARGLLWPRSPWAVKGGLFSSRKGSDFLVDIFTADITQPASTIKPRDI